MYTHKDKPANPDGSVYNIVDAEVNEDFIDEHITNSKCNSKKSPSKRDYGFFVLVLVAALGSIIAYEWQELQNRLFPGPGVNIQKQEDIGLPRGTADQLIDKTHAAPVIPFSPPDLYAARGGYAYVGPWLGPVRWGSVTLDFSASGSPRDLCGRTLSTVTAVWLREGPYPWAKEIRPLDESENLTVDRVLIAFDRGKAFIWVKANFGAEERLPLEQCVALYDKSMKTVIPFLKRTNEIVPRWFTSSL